MGYFITKLHVDTVLNIYVEAPVEDGNAISTRSVEETINRFNAVHSIVNEKEVAITVKWPTNDFANPNTYLCIRSGGGKALKRFALRSVRSVVILP